MKSRRLTRPSDDTILTAWACRIADAICGHQLRPLAFAKPLSFTLEADGLAQLTLCTCDYLKAATRAACSRITRALSSSAVPAGSPLTLTNGLDHTGRRGQPPQLSL